MSHAGADASHNAPTSRGRGGSRGRPIRARGRGRGSFRFPGLKPLESDNFSSPEHPAATAGPQSYSLDGDAKRKPVRKPGERRGSTNAAASESAVETSAPRLEKELPPHIAGAAVDAESLVSRVRELAINGHAHTSSMESRFTMSLNWADEEDDPDSLPDLDDWAIKTKAPPPQSEPVAAQESSTDVLVPEYSTLTLTKPESESQPMPTEPTPSVAAEPSPQPAKEELAQTSTEPQKAETAATTKKVRPGLEASIWASPTPETPPTVTLQKERRARQTNSRGSASISRLTDLPFHPLNIARASESNSPPSSKPDERTTRPEAKTSPRKPHARPVISTDALSRLSRSLGRDAIRQQQSTTT